MKKLILDRYARLPDGRLLIEIDAGKVEDLYNAFDKHAPYRKKELDQELVEYITDAVREIGKEKFGIQFRFTTPANGDLKSRVEKSIHNYFLYLRQLELRELARMARVSFILFSIGFVILFLSIWISQNIASRASIMFKIAIEGLTVAAWVALWNAIATFLINFAPRREQMKRYERISKSEIFFHE